MMYRHEYSRPGIEAGTYLSVADAVGEGIRVKTIEHLESLIAK